MSNWALCTENGLTAFTRATPTSPWEPFPVTVHDLAVAVDRRAAIIAAGPAHPDAIADAIAGSPQVVDGLAQALHEGDWSMSGPEWRWDRARAEDRIAMTTIARALLWHYATTDEDIDQLRARVVDLLNTGWTNRPRHGALRRIETKADRAVAWLAAHTPDFTSGPVTPVESHDNSCG